MSGRGLRSLRAAAVVATLAAAAVAPGLIGRAQDQPRKGSRAVFMRQKLEHSKQILEGLTVEDYDLIAGNAKKLKVLSEAAQFAEPAPIDEKQYESYLLDFRRSVDDLSKQARGKDLEGAALAYLKLTLNCIECHKFVRGEKNPARVR
jgi:hypothetical protein